MAWITGLALAATGVWVAGFSPVFALDPARVTVAMSSEGIVPVDVGPALELFAGTPLPRLDLGEVDAAISALTGVRSVDVERRWPRGLTITIQVRVAVAAIPDAALGYVIVDAEGVALTAVDDAPSDLPVVSVPLGEENVRVLASALGVMGGMPPELVRDVESISAETEDSVVLYLRNGLRVEWGSAAETEFKAEVLLVMLSSPEALLWEVIDLSAPSLPVTRGPA